MNIPVVPIRCSAMLIAPALAVLGLVLAGCKSTLKDSTTISTDAPKADSSTNEVVQTAYANELSPPPTTTAKQSSQALPALFIVGDSTVHNTGPGLKGWGDVIGRYFDTNRIIIENRARGGRSSRTFQTQGWWTNVLAAAQPGDFVLIQLGHNDSSPINDTNRARGTIPGLGEETTNIVNGLTHQPEIVHTYGWYMRKYISDAHAKSMTPIICSSVSRLPQEGKELDTTRYAVWSRELATSQNVLFIDLNHLVLNRYAGMTPAEIKTNYFTPQDNTHFNPTGAELNAACVVEGLRGLTNCALATFLLGKPSD